MGFSRYLYMIWSCLVTSIGTFRALMQKICAHFLYFTCVFSGVPLSALNKVLSLKLDELSTNSENKMLLYHYMTGFVYGVGLLGHPQSYWAKWGACARSSKKFLGSRQPTPLYSAINTPHSNFSPLLPLSTISKINKPHLSSIPPASWFHVVYHADTVHFPLSCIHIARVTI